jgi:hypothetical protein
MQNKGDLHRPAFHLKLHVFRQIKQGRDISELILKSSSWSWERLSNTVYEEVEKGKEEEATGI